MKPTPLLFGARWIETLADFCYDSSNIYIYFLPQTSVRVDLSLSNEDKALIRSAASFVLATIFYVMSFMLLRAVL